MAAIGALIACAAAATGLAPSLHLASLGMPRAATSGVPPLARRPACPAAAAPLRRHKRGHKRGRVAELRTMLRGLGLDEQGRKPELVCRYAESQCVEDEDEEKGTRRRKRTTRKRTMMRKKATRRKAPRRRRARATARRWRARRMVRVLGRSRTCTCVCCLNDLIMRARRRPRRNTNTPTREMRRQRRAQPLTEHHVVRVTVGLGC